MITRSTRILAAASLALIALVMVLFSLGTAVVSGQETRLETTVAPPNRESYCGHFQQTFLDYGTPSFPDNRAHNGSESAMGGRCLSFESALAEASLTKTVGLDPNSCATTTSITVPVGTNVTYCYQMTNHTSDNNLEYHSLNDDHLGSILDYHYEPLPAGNGFWVTQTTWIVTNTINLARWTAYDGNQSVAASAQATASVHVVQAAPAIRLTKTVGRDPNRCALTNEIIVAEQGADVTYCYRATNIGNIPFDELYLQDSQLDLISDTYSATLWPGQSIWLTQTTNIVTSTVNRAQITAYNYNREVVVHDRDWAGVIVGSRPQKEWVADPTETVTGTYRPMNGVGFTTTLVIPAGAVSQTEEITYTPRLVPSHRIPAGVEYANYSFDITVVEDQFLLYLPMIQRSGQSIEHLHNLLSPTIDDYFFNKPVWVIIEYEDGWLPEEIAEETLRLVYWTGGGWADATTTCPGGSVYERDVENNRLRIGLCHFSQWAFIGD